MRKLLAAIVLAVTSLTAVPASAQSLGNILGMLGGGETRSANGFIVPNGGYLGGYNCYGSGTVAQVACRVQQVEQIRRDREYRRQQDAYRQREQFDQRARQLDALQRACQAGDGYSCQRTGGGDQRSMSIARALMDACQAGDRESCARAQDIMDGGRRGYARR